MSIQNPLKEILANCTTHEDLIAILKRTAARAMDLADERQDPSMEELAEEISAFARNLLPMKPMKADLSKAQGSKIK